MSKHHRQFALPDRISIKMMLEEGCAVSHIAEKLGFERSSLYKEIKRGSHNGVYDPEYSHERIRQNKSKQGAKTLLETEPELAQHIANLILDSHKSVTEIVELLKTSSFKNTPSSNKTIYTAIQKGLIPGVTMDSLKRDVAVYKNGSIRLPKSIQVAAALSANEQLACEVNKDGSITIKKVKESYNEDNT